MAIKKVWIEEGCTVCGLCENICPEVFRIEDLATVIDGADLAHYDAQIKDAADSCPVEVIKFLE
jgi:ferredoxin